MASGLAHFAPRLIFDTAVYRSRDGSKCGFSIGLDLKMLEVWLLAVLNGHKVLEQRIFLQTCTQKLAYLHMSWTLHVCL